MDVLKVGWVFILPIVDPDVLPVLARLPAWCRERCIRPRVMVVLMTVIRDRRPAQQGPLEEASCLGSGEILVPLILIGGAAGIILGVMNATGLAFQLSLILAHLGEDPRRPGDACC